MKKLELRPLGKTGINVSRFAVGTGTSGFSGKIVQAAAPPEEYARILVRSVEEFGVNVWDTAHTYGTYPHLRAALVAIPRERVVLFTKTCAASKADAIREVEHGLRALGVDYFDAAFLHAIRSKRELKSKYGALQGLLEMKKQGRIRAVGLSAHGIGGIEGALHTPEIDVAMVRINYQGVCMDAWQEGLVSRAAGSPLLRKAVKACVPSWIIPSLSGMVEPAEVDERLQRCVLELMQQLHEAGKGVLGMKLFGAGRLASSVADVYTFARRLDFVDSFVIGVTTKSELEQGALALAR